MTIDYYEVTTTNAGRVDSLIDAALDTACVGHAGLSRRVNLTSGSLLLVDRTGTRLLFLLQAGVWRLNNYRITDARPRLFAGHRCTREGYRLRAEAADRAQRRALYHVHPDATPAREMTAVCR